METVATFKVSVVKELKSKRRKAKAEEEQPESKVVNVELVPAKGLANEALGRAYRRSTIKLSVDAKHHFAVGQTLLVTFNANPVAIEAAELEAGKRKESRD